MNILYRRSPKFVPWRRCTCLRNTKPPLFLDSFVKIGKHADSAKKIVERATSPPGHRCFYTRRDSQGRLPSRRLKEEAAQPRGIFAYRRKKIKLKASWSKADADFHVHFYGGKIISFVISIWKRRSTRYGVVSKNLRRGDRYLSVDRDTRI